MEENSVSEFRASLELYSVDAGPRAGAGVLGPPPASLAVSSSVTAPPRPPSPLCVRVPLSDLSLSLAFVIISRAFSLFVLFKPALCGWHGGGGAGREQM